MEKEKTTREFYTPRDIEGRLGMSHSEISRLAKLGKLPFKYILSGEKHPRCKIPVKAFEAWMEGRA